MGATFKENVGDIRNSKVVDIIQELKDFNIHVDVIDPYASGIDLQNEYKFSLSENASNDYDAVIVAVAHKDYLNLDEFYFSSITSSPAILIDVKGIYRGKIKKMKYWSL